MKFLWFFFFLFVVEVWLLISLGSEIGFLLTLLEFFVSGIIGISLVRLQGFTLLAQVRNNVNRGMAPKKGLMDGLLTIVAGLLLILPGFATDGLALFLLLPGIKNRLVNRFWFSLKKSADKNKDKDSVVIDQID